MTEWRPRVSQNEARPRDNTSEIIKNDKKHFPRQPYLIRVQFTHQRGYQLILGYNLLTVTHQTFGTNNIYSPLPTGRLGQRWPWFHWGRRRTTTTYVGHWDHCPSINYSHRLFVLYRTPANERQSYETAWHASTLDAPRDFNNLETQECFVVHTATVECWSQDRTWRLVIINMNPWKPVSSGPRWHPESLFFEQCGSCETKQRGNSEFALLTVCWESYRKCK